jgi:hypothetical protein
VFRRGVALLPRVAVAVVVVHKQQRPGRDVAKEGDERRGCGGGGARRVPPQRLRARGRHRGRRHVLCARQPRTALYIEQGIISVGCME